MDCFPDFCLGCDKAAVDGFYCSESCRMSDLERSGSAPGSPSHASPASTDGFYTSFFAQPPSRYPPPPTRALSLVNLHSKVKSTKSHHHHGKSSSTKSLPISTPRVLSPSSSRSSLMLASSPNPDHVSEDAAKELLNYFNAFDRTREERRKSLPGQSLPWTGH